MPLKKFGKTFNLDCEKEVMPYSAYTKENISKRYVALEELKKHTGKDTEQFLENIKNVENLKVEVK